jgi:LacI family transcriptional regulator
MRSTLRDVAQAAGVSVMSACAVLTGGGRNVKVSEDKAKLIREKAAELQYEPNLMGRGLRTRKTDTIGVVFQHLTSFGEEPYYYQQLLDGIMAALFPHGYTLALSPMLIQGDGPVQISNGRFDGILWCCPDLIETSVESTKSLRMPVVMVHAPQDVAVGLPTFAADNERAMDRIVKHLVGLGHESIGFVVKPHVARTVEGKARMAAFLKAGERLAVKVDVLEWEYDVKQLAKYASNAPPHTALTAYNDVHAGHILSRAAELDIRVPDDLSIVGFDSSSFCERTQPRLTSVHQPIERIAREATECLLRLINAGRDSIPDLQQFSTLYDCQLDIRDSTAAPNPHRRGHCPNSNHSGT